MKLIGPELTKKLVKFQKFVKQPFDEKTQKQRR